MCHLCQKVTDTYHNIICCKAPTAKLHQDTRKNALDEEPINIDTHSNMILFMKMNLQALACMLLDLGGPEESDMRQIADEQVMIGWEHLILGIGDLRWRTIQHNYLTWHNKNQN